MRFKGHMPSSIASSPAVRSKSTTWYPLPHSPIRSPPAATLSLRRPAPSLRRDFSSLMASPAPSLAPGSPFELNDESDFDSIITPDGFLSVLGFGSLLSERSAKSTFPDLKNFRVAVLRGFRRVFAHVAPIFFERGIANEATGEVSSLSVEPCEGEFLIVTVFEIKKEEIPAFIERENEFRFLAVYPEYLDGISYTNPAVTRALFSISMDDTTYRRYGVMIFCLVGYILGIVFSLPKTLGSWLMTIS
ncbi:uncharacterized protein LOC141828038 isoform X2 [Curcuma longa]|uniref:uncharacterized protein LOC141828038 isoform X2 n=1 Tax=Curcuma longa TaxID=136217 RepID=UPI003D9F871D